MITNVKAHFPAEQPSSCKDSRIPPAYENSCRARHLGRPSSQGSRRTFGVAKKTVLARESRIRSGADYRQAMKTGIKISGTATVLYLQRDESLPRARCGFIVSKAVGGAVKRNLIKRRLRAVARQLISSEPFGYNLVIRALPEAGSANWNRLQQEVLNNAKAAFGK